MIEAIHFTGTLPEPEWVLSKYVLSEFNFVHEKGDLKRGRGLANVTQ